MVVLRGAGKAFCGGGDIARFAAAGDEIHDFVNSLGPAIQTFVQWFGRRRPSSWPSCKARSREADSG